MITWRRGPDSPAKVGGGLAWRRVKGGGNHCAAYFCCRDLGRGKCEGDLDAGVRIAICLYILDRAIQVYSKRTRAYVGIQLYCSGTMSVSDDAVSVAGSVAPSSAGMGSLVGGFKRQSERNMDKINTSAGNNIELQILLISTIESYNEAKAHMLASGQSVAELALSTGPKRRCVRQPEGELVVPVIEPGLKFRRGQMTIASWVGKLVRECCHFVDSGVFTNTFVEAVSVKVLLECLEFGCDVKVVGEQLDKVGSEYKLQQFERMNDVYECKGKPWRDLVWQGNCVDWADTRNALFKKTIAEDGTIEILCKAFLKWFK